MIICSKLSASAVVVNAACQTLLLHPALPAAWQTYQFAEVQTRSFNYSQTSLVTATRVKTMATRQARRAANKEGNLYSVKTGE
ncbi:hypothetical protein WJX77_007229 [Trebouxia sp. C0004]